jgi:Holliday junction resolvase RusA-like endonuclease
VRKTASQITDDELSFLYDLLDARYPVATTEALVATFDVFDAQAKQRHRKGGAGHMYMPKETKDAEAVIAWLFRREARAHQVDKTGRYGLLVDAAGANAAADVDNLAKTVMDALQGAAYKNDRQVDELHVRRLPGTTPRTEITVYRVEGPLDQGFGRAAA